MVVADFQIFGMCPILKEAFFSILSAYASKSIGGAVLRCRCWIPSWPGDVLDARFSRMALLKESDLKDIKWQYVFICLSCASEHLICLVRITEGVQSFNTR